MSATDYQKISLKEQILKNPGMFVGAMHPEQMDVWVSGTDYQEITIIPGFYKIFDEILVNAIDHSVRDPTVKKINVTLNQETGEISVYNNGNGIPVDIHPEYKVYAAELIFGNLLSSSNYNTKERIVGGKNGLGAKLCAVFSKRFHIETVDSVRKKKYTQVFEDNLSKIHKPVIVDSKEKGYTKITFLPDYQKFGLEGLDDSHFLLFRKRTISASAVTNKSVVVTFNETQVPFKTFEDYANEFIGRKSEWKRLHYQTDNFEIIVTKSPTGRFTHESYVNGIWTNKGGKHLNAVVNGIVSYFQSLGIKKSKGVIIKPSVIRESLMFFIKCTIVNPDFSSQTKEELTTPVKQIAYPEDFLKKLSQIDIILNLVDLSTEKTKAKIAKTTDGSKKSQVIIENLSDAVKAGTKESNKCTLILTEGLSAKQFAMAGLSTADKDYYGIFPLRGKLLNVGEATIKQLETNKEILAIKQIMGLSQSKKYTTQAEISTLRYSRIIILTDADVDGDHIKGLIMNLFFCWWPSLFAKSDFITSLKTPIVIATKGKQVKKYYNLGDFKDDTNKGILKGFSVKYYKGLGTSDDSQAIDCFQNMNLGLIKYKFDNNSIDAMKTAFSKDFIQQRKEWIRNYDPGYYLSTLQQTHKEFIDGSLKHFSVYDNLRSIPCIVDGLKVSQRKILYTAFEKNTYKSTKVLTFIGEIIKASEYHHGDSSLYTTIVKMAGDYVGSNNINLFVPDGQFGSRIAGDDSAAQARYIYTYLNPIVDKLFNKDDAEILDYNYEDSHKVEPKWYIPLIPMILVNGAEGIGTGFSTFIPKYDPTDIITVMKEYIYTGQMPTRKIFPWYKDFQGEITENGDNYSTHGFYTKNGPGDITITEIPIGMTLEKLHAKIKKLQEAGKIKLHNEKSTKKIINENILFTEEIDDESIYKLLGLTTSINTTNMHLFDENYNLKKYESVHEIIKEFCDIKKKLLVKRKKHIIDKTQVEIQKCSNKMRFISLVMNSEIVIFRQPRQKIIETLESLQFEKVNDSYDYLVKIPLDSFIKESIDKLESTIEKLNTDLDTLINTTIEIMFISELNLITKEDLESQLKQE